MESLTILYLEHGKKIQFPLTEVNTLGSLCELIHYKCGIPKKGFFQVFFIEFVLLTEENYFDQVIEKGHHHIKLFVKGTHARKIADIGLNLEIKTPIHRISVKGKLRGNTLLHYPYNLHSTIADVKDIIKLQSGFEPSCQVLVKQSSSGEIQIVQNGISEFLVDLCHERSQLTVELCLFLIIDSSRLDLESRILTNFILVPEILLQIGHGKEKSSIYPLLKIGDFSVKGVKVFIEKKYGINRLHQVLLVNNEVLNHEEHLITHFGNQLSQQELRISALPYATDNNNLLKFYQSQGFASLGPVKIFSMRNRSLLLTYFFQNNNILNENVLEEFVESDIFIPSTAQRYFWNGYHFKNFGNVLKSYLKKVMSCGYVIDFNVDFAVYVDKDTESTVLNQISALNIDTIGPIKIIHPNNGTEIGEYLMYCTTSDLIKKQLEMDHNIDANWIELLFRNRFLRSHDCLDEIMYNECSHEKNLFLTMVVHSNSTPRFQSFTKRNNISLLVKVKVASLTGNIFSIDLTTIEKQNITALKLAIQRLKKIPIHLQELFYCKEKLDNHLHLLTLCIREGVFTPDLTLNLVVGSPKILTLHVSCNFPMSSYDIEISENSTISQLKENISNASGILKSQLDVKRFSVESFEDKNQIWELEKVSVRVDKFVQVIIEKESEESLIYNTMYLTDDTVVKRISHQRTDGRKYLFFYHILNWNEDTVDSMRDELHQYYVCEGRRFSFDSRNAKNHISHFTHLKDIVEVPVMLNFTRNRNMCNIL